MRCLAPAVAACLVAWAPLALAAEDTVIREVVREVLSDPSYETELPTRPTPMAPRDRRAQRHQRIRRTQRGPSPAPVSSGSSASEALLLVALGVVAAAVAVWIGVEVRRRRQRPQQATVDTRGGAEVDGPGAAAVRAMPATLARARALAAEGRLQEAVHVLLRGGIETVATLADLRVTPAMTSRELLADATLDAPAHTAFGDLVRSVEVSLFGGVAVTGGDFDRCAASFAHLHGRLQ